MKKILIVILFVLNAKTTITAQNNPIKKDSVSKSFYNNEVNGFVKSCNEHSTLIIEGKIIGHLRRIIDNLTNKDGGNFYELYLIKPISVLKGNTDTTKTYQIILKGGSYFYGFIDKSDTLTQIIYSSFEEESYNEVPQSGIFFINETITPSPNPIRCMDCPDTKARAFNTIFPNSILVDYRGCLNFGRKQFPREKVLKFLLEKFNLSATPLK